ncbi:hypothetical protein B0T25DRAFT_356190 [Lasiosphaeria hispida]|uniref:Uncharacterized protein n=1 Tax=Lasiosphaeria hispida TaxID=260671 RepID=A0AAJ0H782_9PEZI|nr:hypothetical protein B0T25DRAFT_356190 [Lasiosphaeria hispida]
MAAFDPIEFHGIAYDRDINILHDDDNVLGRPESASPSLSFSSVGFDEALVKCRPWFSVANPLVALARPPSPTESFTNLTPEDLFAHPGQGPFIYSSSAGLYGLRDDDDNTTSDAGPGDMTPLGMWASKPGRHEQIALSLAVGARCQMPYHDYLPCPGSGPGSPAVSTVTEAIEPAVRPPCLMVEPPSDDIPGFTTAAATGRAPSPTQGSATPVMTPMKRFLSDTHQTHEWLALVLEKPCSRVVEGQTQGQVPDMRPATDPGQVGRQNEATPMSSISLDGTSNSSRDHGSHSFAMATAGGEEPYPSLIRHRDVDADDVLINTPIELDHDESTEGARRIYPTRVADYIRNFSEAKMRERFHTDRPRWHKPARLHKKRQQGDSPPENKRARTAR